MTAPDRARAVSRAEVVFVYYVHKFRFSFVNSVNAFLKNTVSKNTSKLPKWSALRIVQTELVLNELLVNLAAPVACSIYY